MGLPTEINSNKKVQSTDKGTWQYLKVMIANGDCGLTCFKTRGPKGQTILCFQLFLYLGFVFFSIVVFLLKHFVHSIPKNLVWHLIEDKRGENTT